MSLVYVAGCHFETLLHVIHNQIRNVRPQIRRLEQLDKALEQLERQESASGPETARISKLLRRLRRELLEDAFAELAMRWRELRALRMSTDEISERFDGEDPLHPEIRARFDQAKATADELNKALFAGKPRRWPNPDDADIEMMTKLIDDGLAAVGLVYPPLST